MRVFTTGQVAKICKVAPRTVNKWFDSGRLKGYRIPGTHDRRIPRENLIRFMKEFGLSTEPVDGGQRNLILVFSQDEELIYAFKDRLVPQGFEIVSTDTSFEAGMKMQERTPGCLVVDFSYGSTEAMKICENFQQRGFSRRTVLVALVLDDRQKQTARRANPEDIFQKPFDPELLIVSLASLLDD